MKKDIINIENWKRKNHFLFFNQMDDPTYDVTSRLDCTKAYARVKEKGYSFFLYYLHCSMKAVNAVEEFKYRLEDEKVVLYDIIHAGPTIARENETFGFSHLPYFDDFDAFSENAQKIIETVKKADDLNPSFHRNDVVHYSSIPWIDFSSVTHPHFSFKIKESVPKITFGKLVEKNNKKSMAVSVKTNHAFVDGIHIGKYLNSFQKYLDE